MVSRAQSSNSVWPSLSTSSSRIGVDTYVCSYANIGHNVQIGRECFIATGAKILGNIEIGIGAKVAACSVVLRDVPPHTTVAGIPARVVAKCTVAEPALEMDSTFPFAEEGAGI